MTSNLFAIEQYEPGGASSTPGSVSRLTTARTRLVAAVRLPADDVVLALVEGPDAGTVADVAGAAGWRVDRLSPAAWLFPQQPGH